MYSYVSVFPDFLPQSKQFQFTGSGEGLSRLDIVMLEADRTAAFPVLEPSPTL